MTRRQEMRAYHDAFPDRECICPADPDANLTVMTPHAICLLLACVNRSIAEALEALEQLGPGEPGEGTSRWKIR